MSVAGGRTSRGTGLGFNQGLGNQGQVCFHGVVDDPERPLSIAHPIGSPADNAGEVQFELELASWMGLDASRGAGVLRRVCQARTGEPAHKSLFYILSEGST